MIRPLSSIGLKARPAAPMSARRPKDDPNPSSSPPPAESLLTSEDLFGDMVDAPVPEDTVPIPSKPARKDRIKVQISDPEARQRELRNTPDAGRYRPAAPAEMKEADDDEVAALLDGLGPGAGTPPPV